MIFAGDFLQLGPVCGRWRRNAAAQTGPRLAFMSPSWARAGLVHHKLRRTHRHRPAAGGGPGPVPTFATVLGEVRVGRVSPDVASAIRCTEDQAVDAAALHAYGTNGEAGAHNEARLDELPGAAVEVAATDECHPGGDAGLFDDRCPVPGRLCVKVGAEIMLRANFDVGVGLVNGAARGVVLPGLPGT